jgi:hypothetical protein
MSLLDFADNELIIIDGPNFTGAVVTSTGDRNKFTAEVSIRGGITKKVTLTYDEVAQLVVDAICNGKTLKKNAMFAGGVKEAVEHCRKIYRDKGGKEIAYDEIDTDAITEKHKVTDLPYEPN